MDDGASNANPVCKCWSLILTTASEKDEGAPLKANFGEDGPY